MKSMLSKFSAYAPDWKGPITPEQSVSLMQSVIANASIEKGNGGDFISHLGNQTLALMDVEPYGLCHRVEPIPCSNSHTLEYTPLKLAMQCNDWRVTISVPSQHTRTRDQSRL